MFTNITEEIKLHIHYRQVFGKNMQPPHLGAVLVHLAILQDGVLLVIRNLMHRV